LVSHAPAVAHHFETAPQQREAAELGMWLFLATEFMFFGGLFLAYFIFRGWYWPQFVAGSQSMDVTLGTVNTAALLTSSLTMALAVHAAGRGGRRPLILLLSITAMLGLVFLGIKAYEYHHKYEHGLMPFVAGGLVAEHGSLASGQREGLVAFLNLYFLMTGLHALHMVIGIAALSILIAGALRGWFLGPRSIVVHNVGLYWHFVDLVWVYLFPFFYLIAASGTQPVGH
jgi:cytochrome c oxidase subunit 3